MPMARWCANSLRFPDKHRARDPKSLAMVQGLKVERRIKRALYLGHAFTHFGHFLIETVPALWWARQVDDDVALIFHPFDEAGRNVFAETAHGRDCLALLGLAPERIVMATADLAVEELLLPPRHYDMRTGPRYDFREIYRTLTAAAQRSQPTAAASRIYLSRRSAEAAPAPPVERCGGGAAHRPARLRNRASAAHEPGRPDQRRRRRRHRRRRRWQRAASQRLHAARRRACWCCRPSAAAPSIS